MISEQTVERQKNNDESGVRLAEFGFLFDPFHHLEASSDPHLFEYLIDDNLPRTMWLPGATVLFSPRGGGKTALRMYMTREFWSRFDNHPFPIHLFPQPNDLTDATPRGIWRPLVRGLSKAIVIALCYRPVRFLDAPEREWEQMLRLLAPHLPRALNHYVKMLGHYRATGSVSQALELVRNSLDRSYRIPAPPEAGTFAEMLRRLELSVLHIEPMQGKVGVWNRSVIELTSLLSDIFRFQEFAVLIDGVDAYPQAVAPLDRAGVWLIDALRRMDRIEGAAIHVKCFVPHLLRLYVEPHVGPSDAQVSFESLSWSSDDLVRLLRARILIATGGRYDSLDALSSPGINAIEEQIATTVQPLPREALYLAGQLLHSHLSHRAALSTLIEPEDLTNVVEPYKRVQWKPQTW